MMVAIKYAWVILITFSFCELGLANCEVSTKPTLSEDEYNDYIRYEKLRADFYQNYSELDLKRVRALETDNSYDAQAVDYFFTEDYEVEITIQDLADKYHASEGRIKYLIEGWLEKLKEQSEKKIIMYQSKKKKKLIEEHKKKIAEIYQDKIKKLEKKLREQYDVEVSVSPTPTPPPNNVWQNKTNSALIATKGFSFIETGEYQGKPTYDIYDLKLIEHPEEKIQSDGNHFGEIGYWESNPADIVMGFLDCLDDNPQHSGPGYYHAVSFSDNAIITGCGLRLDTIFFNVPSDSYNGPFKPYLLKLNLLKISNSKNCTVTYHVYGTADEIKATIKQLELDNEKKNRLDAEINEEERKHQYDDIKEEFKKTKKEEDGFGIFPFGASLDNVNKVASTEYHECSVSEKPPCFNSAEPDDNGRATVQINGYEIGTKTYNIELSFFDKKFVVYVITITQLTNPLEDTEVEFLGKMAGPISLPWLSMKNFDMSVQNWKNILEQKYGKATNLKYTLDISSNARKAGQAQHFFAQALSPVSIPVCGDYKSMYSFKTDKLEAYINGAKCEDNLYMAFIKVISSLGLQMHKINEDAAIVKEIDRNRKLKEKRNNAAKDF